MIITYCHIAVVERISEHRAMRSAVLTAVLVLVYIQDAAAGKKHPVRNLSDREQQQNCDRHGSVLTLCESQFLKLPSLPSVKTNIHPNHVVTDGTGSIPPGVQSSSW